MGQGGSVALSTAKLLSSTLKTKPTWGRPRERLQCNLPGDESADVLSAEAKKLSARKMVLVGVRRAGSWESAGSLAAEAENFH
ncbi:hypothetical protein P7K49_016545 [Saguinus oedipus]|uniref:Uncharacterized protein n=1 Tax=Saguinus oedipus TaxID=9490 RepID=A0ABQ9VCY8_SAGOE|nr:hypothetical protein P7K49_016545 [Saguinus oedipus]